MICQFNRSTDTEGIKAEGSAYTAISLCFLCYLDFVVLNVYSVIVVWHPYTHFLCTKAFLLNSFVSCVSTAYQMTFFVLPFIGSLLCCLCCNQVRIVSIIHTCISKENNGRKK